VQTDILISLGGGSPIDATKAVARALAQSGGQYLYRAAGHTVSCVSKLQTISGVMRRTARLSALTLSVVSASLEIGNV